jgi:hypothetical protein
MSMPRFVDTSRLQPSRNRGEARPRDVSVSDFAWVANPRIFSQQYVVQTKAELERSNNVHVC